MQESPSENNTVVRYRSHRANLPVSARLLFLQEQSSVAKEWYEASGLR
jgi:hypothetical protein